VTVYVPSFVGVYDTVQLAVLPIPEMVHESVAVFGPLTWKVTTPVGVSAVPALLSVIVTVQLITVPVSAVFGHESRIETARFVTVNDVEDELVEWSVSPV
jgi:hypothetical protein